jgi:hypothetical protein
LTNPAVDPTVKIPEYKISAAALERLDQPERAYADGPTINFTPDTARTASAEKDTRTQTIASPGIALPARSMVPALNQLECVLALLRWRGSSPVVGGGELWANRRFVQALCEQGGNSPPHR